MFHSSLNILNSAFSVQQLEAKKQTDSNLDGGGNLVVILIMVTNSEKGFLNITIYSKPI